MTVPVIRLLLQQHANLEVTVVSAAFNAPLFCNVERLRFYPADLKGRHKGFFGLYRLFKELRRLSPFDAIADLHNVLRTKLLRRFFSFAVKNIAAIDKGRKEKKELTRPHNKIMRPLKSTFQRYADVFEKLALPVALTVNEALAVKPPMPSELLPKKKAGRQFVGVAPVAQYAEKTYPAEKMKEVLRLLSGEERINVFLFGGKAEKTVLEAWERGFENVQNLAGLGLEKELSFLAQMDVVVSMDSANMHLASLYGVPVVSVWGGTHPYLGFMGWGQSFENAVQIELPCRPSSVFGRKECPNHGACLNGIHPLAIYTKILDNLKRKHL